MPCSPSRSSRRPCSPSWRLSRGLFILSRPSRIGSRAEQAPWGRAHRGADGEACDPLLGGTGQHEFECRDLETQEKMVTVGAPPRRSSGPSQSDAHRTRQSTVPVDGPVSSGRWGARRKQRLSKTPPNLHRILVALKLDDLQLDDSVRCKSLIQGVRVPGSGCAFGTTCPGSIQCRGGSAGLSRGWNFRATRRKWILNI